MAGIVGSVVRINKNEDENSSCLTNTLLFLDKVLHSVDEGPTIIKVDVVFLDLAKAFDKVPHLSLIHI